MNTKQKLALAGLLSKSLIATRRLFGLPNQVTAYRQKRWWHLELNQGIDLAIYLFGCFEPDVKEAYSKLVRPGAVVLDIGANIGAHTLPLAGLVGKNGRVFAFEPTDYAFEKLTKNLAANPQAAQNVSANQIILGGPGTTMPRTIPSSWPLNQGQNTKSHPIHKGSFNPLIGAKLTTLDHWSRQAGIKRLDFIKMDVDGFEVDVLEGGKKTISRFKPTIIMELAPYALREKKRSFWELLYLIKSLSYICRHLDGTPLSLEKKNLRKIIPRHGSINVILQVKTGSITKG